MLPSSAAVLPTEVTAKQFSESDLTALPASLAAMLVDDQAPQGSTRSLGIAPLIARSWARFSCASRYLREQFNRQNPALAALICGDALRQGDAVGALRHRFLQLRVDAPVDQAMRELRMHRNAEMVGIVLRDWLGWASVDETLLALSALAEESLGFAVAHAQRGLRERFGDPIGAETGLIAQPIILGMGKLGGGELNFSSDIDLIFAFTEDGQTNGDVALSHAEYFTRLTQAVIRLLSEPTEDGFVFRIDTQLRPFGSAGAMALSCDAMERYYEQHGREWERYALIKARPVAGDIAAAHELLNRLRPFVYRRYLDYGALGALRDLKRLIDDDARKRGAERNLKLGRGGIRELEFIVQLFQLTRGGHDARLRDCRLRPVLHRLGAMGMLPIVTVQHLDAGYSWLRRCENAVQMYADEQTHQVPVESERQAALCAALEYPDWAAFEADWTRVRDEVHATFLRIFSDPAAVASAEDGAALRLWRAERDTLAQWLTARGYVKDATSVAQAIETLRQSRQVRALNEIALGRLRELVTLLVDVCVALPNPEVALTRTLSVIHSIVGRATYLTLLSESATARRRLAEWCGASPWITALLTQTPALLDALLDPRMAQEVPDHASIRAALADRAAGVAADDVEAVMDLLRRFRQEMTLRIAAADLSGVLPLVEVSDCLTWLAEAIVDQALRAARVQMTAQYGTAYQRNGASGEFAIIGYGKFGSYEMGYGSDLDLVFVYDTEDPDQPTQGGARAIAAADYYLRLAQRVVQLLSAQTASGRAYEVDLELRPSGNSGLAVTRLSGFARYQRENAWTWEHQALLRARVVAGDARLAAQIHAIRSEVLMRPRDAQKLRAEVQAMREKMRTALEKRSVDRWDVKQGNGGLIDAEFLTQYLCLCYAHQYPSLVEFSSNWRQLDALAAAKVIDAKKRDDLLASGRAFRNFLHRRALQQQDSLSENIDFKSERAAVTALWQEIFGATI